MNPSEARLKVELELRAAAARVAPDAIFAHERLCQEAGCSNAH
jgi:hypothetical protein